jgi:hypothetical protein
MSRIPVRCGECGGARRATAESSVRANLPRGEFATPHFPVDEAPVGRHATLCDPGRGRASVGQAVPPHQDATASGGGRRAGPSALAVVLPLHLAPVGNRREHPMARARRTRREIAAVLEGLTGHTPPRLPAVFELTRTGWNPLDPDGLVAALKAPIDALAKWTGADDRDRRLFWRLAQSVTRERRFTRGQWGAASSLRIVVRPWHYTDGNDPLRVLAVAPPALEAS